MLITISQDINFMEILSKYGYNAGCIVTLCDEETIKESLAAGKGIKPTEYTASKVITINEGNNLATWYILYLTETKILVVKSVDTAFDTFIYEDTKLPIGDRMQLIENECQWLFQTPQDINSFQTLDLKYSCDIKEIKDSGEEVTYYMKRQGEMSGNVRVSPLSSGISNLLGTIVEYESEDGRQAILTEIGRVTNDNGGLISLYTGRKIPTKDIDIISK